MIGRILLVEDGPDNQRLICHVLRRAGLSVEVAENGKIGAERALAAQRSTAPFDLVLMDMQMPVMDGYSATKYLREHGFMAPIVALTADAMQSDRARCLEAGCTEHAPKPLHIPELLDLIARLIDARDGRDSQAA